MFELPPPAIWFVAPSRHASALSARGPESNLRVTGQQNKDHAAGEMTVDECMPGHNIGENTKNSIGPIQNGLQGRKSGSIPGYSYSEANKNSGIVWDEATFKEYIKDPRAKIPGTKMTFPGIKDEKDAEDLWSFLEQFGPDGKKN